MLQDAILTEPLTLEGVAICASAPGHVPGNDSLHDTYNQSL